MSNIDYIMTFLVLYLMARCGYDMINIGKYTFNYIPRPDDISNLTIRRLILVLYTTIMSISLPFIGCYALIRFHKDGLKKNVGDICEACREIYLEGIPELWSKDYKP